MLVEAPARSPSTVHHRAGCLGQELIRSNEHAAFTGTEHLSIQEAEGTDHTEATSSLPAPLGPLRVSGILNQVEAPLAADALEFFHLTHRATEVYGHQGSCPVG